MSSNPSIRTLLENSQQAKLYVPQIRGMLEVRRAAGFSNCYKNPHPTVNSLQRPSQFFRGHPAAQGSYKQWGILGLMSLGRQQTRLLPCEQQQMKLLSQEVEQQLNGLEILQRMFWWDRLGNIGPKNTC
ncbi:hypothetical protein PGTUg99_007460 [Puccinia graminis f. sp. tritici]|uniref:Uncharacterized protein n=1 Tax=Puccinia graminis f. sp. tritici TaxID=56615 RepID=A0A5B0MY70_PUCGR|nr:hypothetical protein PGTUg99_007460 [Puccinia graminis f. sp. tritici]